MVLTEVILPVFFVVFLGFLLRKFGKLDEHVLSRTQLYVLTPALVFMAIADAELETALIFRIFFFAASAAAIMLVISQGIGFALRRERDERQALSLASVFMNAGYYGIPVCLLAFGETGMTYAMIFVVATATLQATLGIFLASAGTRKASEALVNVLRVPIIYAIVLGRVLAHINALPPEPFMKMITLLGRSAIPFGLLLLGMQLERILYDGRRGERQAARRDLASGLTAAALRILGGFAVGVLIVRLFDFNPLLEKVLIVELSMPTAVAAVVYATEFDCRPRLVTIAIMASTLVSVISVTLVLAYLG